MSKKKIQLLLLNWKSWIVLWIDRVPETENKDEKKIEARSFGYG